MPATSGLLSPIAAAHVPLAVEEGEGRRTEGASTPGGRGITSVTQRTIRGNRCLKNPVVTSSNVYVDQVGCYDHSARIKGEIPSAGLHVNASLSPPRKLGMTA